MKLQYYPETDSLYIELSSKVGSDVREISDGVVADFDDQGNIVGIDIDHATRKLDLTSLETIELPVKPTKTA